MKWRVLYTDWSIRTSDEYQWEDLPSDNVVKVTIIFDNGGQLIASGWDVYALESEGEGLRLTTWKDEEPSDPFYGRGHSRLFLPNGTSADGIDENGDLIYQIMEAFYHIHPSLRKRGKWVSDDLAKQMGIL